MNIPDLFLAAALTLTALRAGHQYIQQEFYAACGDMAKVGAIKRWFGLYACAVAAYTFELIGRKQRGLITDEQIYYLIGLSLFTFMIGGHLGQEWVKKQT